MKFMVLLLALLGDAVLAYFNELPVHPGVGGLYKGPNSETIIKGPDGSVITAEAEGGAVLTSNKQPIATSALAEPIIPISSGPAIIEIPAVPTNTASHIANKVEDLQPHPHIIETKFASDFPLEISSGLVGPSGSITTRGSSSIVSGSASTIISEPAKVVAALPIGASSFSSVLVTPVAQLIERASITTTSIPLQPPTVTVTVGPPISTARLSPSVSPLHASSLNIGNAVVNVPCPTGTVPPLDSWNLLQSGQLSTPSPATTVNTQAGIIGPLIASVQPASSYGVINSIAKILSPHHLSQTELEIAISKDESAAAKFRDSLEQALANNRHLTVNPSHIPSTNIIPTEIGRFPPGTIDLGTTVAVTSIPISLGSHNIPGIADKTGTTGKTGGRVIEVQEIDVENDETNELFRNQQIRVPNHVLLPDNDRNIDGKLLELQRNAPPMLPLLRHANPVTDGITQADIIGRLAKYNADPSQINLANVPLSYVTPYGNKDAHLPFTRQLHDGSSAYWSRYGIDIKEKKN